MNKQKYSALVELYKTTRGPKPKKETIEGGFSVLCGKKSDRYSTRFAEKILEFSINIDSDIKTLGESFKLYMVANKVESNETTRTIDYKLENKDVSVSKASSIFGVYSSKVYKMYNSVLLFHKLRMKYLES